MIGDSDSLAKGRAILIGDKANSTLIDNVEMFVAYFSTQRTGKTPLSREGFNSVQPQRHVAGQVERHLRFASFRLVVLRCNNLRAYRSRKKSLNRSPVERLFINGGSLAKGRFLFQKR
jgi:hypothetical protein